jgi:hypothetical protein
MPAEGSGWRMRVWGRELIVPEESPEAWRIEGRSMMRRRGMELTTGRIPDPILPPLLIDRARRSPKAFSARYPP